MSNYLNLFSLCPWVYLFNIFSHQPWLTPKPIQSEVGCVIGLDYPEPMLDLAQVGERNVRALKDIRRAVVQQGDSTLPAHCRPSNDAEICKFFWLSDDQSRV